MDLSNLSQSGMSMSYLIIPYAVKLPYKHWGVKKKIKGVRYEYISWIAG